MLPMDTIPKAPMHLPGVLWGDREGLTKAVTAFGVDIQVLNWYLSGLLAKHPLSHCREEIPINCSQIS